MMFKKTIPVSLLLFVLLLAIQGCFTKPDFPFETTISFESISSIGVPDGNGGTIQDSIWVSINYRDGNGDLGLNPTDVQPPFQEFEVIDDDTVPNFFSRNIYLRVERRVGGAYVPFVFDNDSTSLSGRFPRVLEEDDANPVEGIITYKDIIPGGVFPPNDTVRFRVIIIDRALNISNEITTDSIIINQAF
ncbi:MAG: hypothetical protein AAF734_01615 [Bacteroidota bacterium]